MTENVQWVKFYFDKWRNDPGLRVCSLAARGLWMDLLCVMHNATPYGHLVVNMKPLSERDVTQLVGTSSLKEIKKLLRELKDAGVFSETSDGVVYCRRMVRDNEIREKAKVYGKSGGNPALKNGRGGVNPAEQGSGDLPLKLEKEKEKEKERIPPKVPARSAPLEGGFEIFWKLYPRKQEGPAACRKEWDRALKVASPEEIISGLRRYPFKPDFLPMAATWLNQKRWLTQANTPPPLVLSDHDPTFSPGAL